MVYGLDFRIGNNVDDANLFFWYFPYDLFLPYLGKWLYLYDWY
jgi:hypothetical protein